MRLTVDGTVHERRASSVLIANLGAVLGGLIRFGDNILHDDGLLHACRLFAGQLLGHAAHFHAHDARRRA